LQPAEQAVRRQDIIEIGGQLLLGDALAGLDLGDLREL
jgi:hypothetical protein